MTSRHFFWVYGALLAAYLAFDLTLTVIGFEHPAAPVIAWSSWILVFGAGVAAGLAGRKPLSAALLSLPFAAIGFGHGVLAFTFGWGGAPSDWSSEGASRMFQGFMISSAIFAVFGMVIAGLGALGGRYFSRENRA
jgi:hypothetical protein